MMEKICQHCQYWKCRAIESRSESEWGICNRLSVCPCVDAGWAIPRWTDYDAFLEFDCSGDCEDCHSLALWTRADVGCVFFEPLPEQKEAP